MMRAVTRVLTVGCIACACAGVITWFSLSPSVKAEHFDLKPWIAERVAQFATWESAEQNDGTANSLAGADGLREIWDRWSAPLLVVVPAGEYAMGSPAFDVEHFADEIPQHRVAIDYEIAVGKFPVTRGEFAFFVAVSGYVSSAKCYGYADDTFLKYKSRFTWRNPGFAQSDDDPVVCVDWADARAYVAWLSDITGRRYRLLSEAEWEYAARAGTTTARWWGPTADSGCTAANGADLSAKKRFTDWEVANCDDGYVFTSPVGHFRPNPFGLYDMLGNIWQWVEDCTGGSYAENAPADGGSHLTGDCTKHMMRGGSWHSHPRHVRSAVRRADETGIGYAAYGFRVARELTSARR